MGKKKCGIAQFQNEFSMFPRLQLQRKQETKAIYLATSLVKEPVAGELTQTINISRENLDQYGILLGSETKHSLVEEVKLLARNLSGFSVVVSETSDGKDFEAVAKPVFFDATVSTKTGLTLKVNNFFAPMFQYMKKGGFTLVDMMDMRGFNTYASILYPIVKGRLFKANLLNWKGDLFAVKDLRNAFGIPPTKHKLFANFHRLITAAIEEIHRKTSLVITATPEKTGRAYTHIRLHVYCDKSKFTQADLIDTSNIEIDSVIMMQLKALDVRNIDAITNHYDPDQPEILRRALEIFEKKSAKWPAKIRAGSLVKYISNLIEEAKSKINIEKVMRSVQIGEQQIQAAHKIKEAEEVAEFDKWADQNPKDFVALVDRLISSNEFLQKNMFEKGKNARGIAMAEFFQTQSSKEIHQE